MMAKSHELFAPSRTELDLGDPASIAGAVSRSRPELIANTAAYNDVDGAEREPGAALRINRDAVAVLGEQALRHRAALVHYSTDFVFDGKKAAPYLESDAPEPLGAYARSKLAGERALLDLRAPALILRTAWVYSLRRKSFVSTILRLARERQELRVVDDQVGNPTYCADLARATVELAERLGPDPHAGAVEHAGVYHAAGGGSCSRFELARAVLELDPRREEHVVRAVLPISSAEMLAPAPRPASAPLDCTKLERRFGIRLPPWRDALKRALQGV